MSALFCYEVFGEKRYLDPQETYRLLYEHPNGLLDELVAKAKDRAPENRLDRLRALAEIALTARTVFDLPPIDRSTGEGYTEAECIEVFNSFFAWCDGIKKKRADSPTLSQPSETPSFAGEL